MSKKYVPSGYQIIDLGSMDLISDVTLNKGTSEDVYILISLLYEDRLLNKPILLKLRDTDGDIKACGFCSATLDSDGYLLSLHALTCGGTEYQYNITLDESNVYVSRREL